MRVGVNLMIWTLAVQRDDLALLERCQRLGVDGVEIPIGLPPRFDPADLRARLRDLRLECTTTTSVPRGGSLLREDEQPAGIAALRRAIEITSRLGASILSGPIYAPVGQLSGAGPTPREWACAVTGLRDVARIAADHGVTVNLEPLNRFETYFLNTASDAVRLLADVGSPHLGLLLDTFHMNIEEKSLPLAIQEAGPWLKHFHCSENDRGPVGTGHIDWPGVISALRRIGYDGWLTIESFARPDAGFAAAAIWRPLAASPDALAEQSVGYVRTLIGQSRPA